MMRLSLMLTTVCAVLVPLSPAAIEQSSVGGTGPTLMNNQANSIMVNAGVKTIDARMENVINCQKDSKLWNGTTCVEAAGTGTGDGVVAMEIVMNPAIMIPAKVAGPVIPTSSGNSTQCSNWFGLGSAKCASNMCTVMYTCNEFQMYPDIKQTGGKLYITPHACQQRMDAYPC